MQNFNRLGFVVLEIPAFQYEAYHRFRAGAGVHKLFVGGVFVIKFCFLQLLLQSHGMPDKSSLNMNYSFTLLYIYDCFVKSDGFIRKRRWAPSYFDKLQLVNSIQKYGGFYN